MEDSKIKELADAYANGKAEATLNAAIAEAYTEGFRAGYKAREKEQACRMTGGKAGFIDLGLPSGTLWASDFVEDEDKNRLYLPFLEASGLALPTEEQWNELRAECRWRYDRERVDHGGTYHYEEWYECRGPNGKHVNFRFTRGETDENTLRRNREKAVFWLKSGKVAICYGENDRLRSILKCFSGYRQAIRLVKNK